MEKQFARTAFFTLMTCGVGCMGYAIQNNSHGYDLLGLSIGMLFNFWVASSKFDDAFKK